MAIRRWAPLIPLLPALASCAGIEAFGGYTQMKLSGTVALDNSAGTADLDAIQNDVETDFGLGDQVGAPYVRGVLDLGGITLTGSGFTFDETGTGTLSQPFGDLPAGRTVATDFSLVNMKGAVGLDILDVGAVRVSPGVAVDVFDIDIRLVDQGTMEFEQVDSLAPIPMVFVQGEADLEFVGATLDIGWMSAEFNDVDGTWIDIEGLARLKLMPGMQVFAGYRYISIDGVGDADGRDYLADLELEGWTVGVGLVW